MPSGLDGRVYQALREWGYLSFERGSISWPHDTKPSAILHPLFRPQQRHSIATDPNEQDKFSHHEGRPKERRPKETGPRALPVRENNQKENTEHLEIFMFIHIHSIRKKWLS